MNFRACRAGALLALFILPSTAMQAGRITGPWEERLSPKQPGSFPLFGDVHAEFVFGWSNVPAGRATFTFSNPPGPNYHGRFHGMTTDFARTLWQTDIHYDTHGLKKNLQPLGFRQVEYYRSYRIEIDAEFTPENFRRIRQRIPSRDRASWRSFELPGLRDLLATMLFVHSQPLRPGDQILTLCHPGDAPYLVGVSVRNRETLVWQDRELPVIRLDIELQRIETRGAERGELRPHRRFRSGSVWISDDNRRLPLRAEVSIFIGFVYAELVSWEDR